MVAQVVWPDMEMGVNWLWHVPSLLCDEGLAGRPRPELVEWALSDFQRRIEGVRSGGFLPRAHRGTGHSSAGAACGARPCNRRSEKGLRERKGREHSRVLLGFFVA